MLNCRDPCSARGVSQQCQTAEYPCSAQQRTMNSDKQQSVHARGGQMQNVLAPHNHRISLQCPTAEYPCSAKRQVMLAVGKGTVAVHRQQSVPAVPSSRISLQCLQGASLLCPTSEYACCVQPKILKRFPVPNFGYLWRAQPRA